ncbi:MAG: 3-hydroxyacyl-CoA dehydrogenase family protein [Fusobacteriaceae bacterium]
MKKIFVLGTGVMAKGIVQEFLLKGYEVCVYGRENKKLEELKNYIKSIFLTKLLLSEYDVEIILTRLSLTIELEKAKNADLVLEALVEDLDLKKYYFKILDNLCDTKTLFCTNTSSLSITEIAAVTSRVDKVIGMHFFNPVNKMKLVEIVKGISTSEKSLEIVKGLVSSLEKEFVIVNEIPGFIVNRILIPMINEAILLLEQNVATVEDIDKAMMLGANHPLGPLALADLIGNDVVLKIMDSIYSETKDTKYRASYLLRKYVSSGCLGRKTKKGFYNY